MTTLREVADQAMQTLRYQMLRGLRPTWHVYCLDRVYAPGAVDVVFAVFDPWTSQQFDWRAPLDPRLAGAPPREILSWLHEQIAIFDRVIQDVEYGLARGWHTAAPDFVARVQAARERDAWEILLGKERRPDFMTIEQLLRRYAKRPIDDVFDGGRSDGEPS